MSYCSITIEEYRGNLRSDIEVDYLPMFKEYIINTRGGQFFEFKKAKDCLSKMQQLKTDGLAVPAHALKWIEEEATGPYGKKYVWLMIHPLFISLIMINAFSAAVSDGWKTWINIGAGIIIMYFYVTTVRSVRKGWNKILAIRRK